MEKYRAEKGTRARRETELFDVEEEIRTSSLKRLGCERIDDKEVETLRKKKKVIFEVDNEVMLMEEEPKARRQMESVAMEINEKRFQLEERREEREAVRTERRE